MVGRTGRYLILRSVIKVPGIGIGNFSIVADGEFLLNLESPGIIIDRFT